MAFSNSSITFSVLQICWLITYRVQSHSSLWYKISSRKFIIKSFKYGYRTLGLKLWCTWTGLVAPKHVQIISVVMYECQWYYIMEVLIRHKQQQQKKHKDNLFFICYSQYINLYTIKKTFSWEYGKNYFSW